MTNHPSYIFFCCFCLFVLFHHHLLFYERNSYIIIHSSAKLFCTHKQRQQQQQVREFWIETNNNPIYYKRTNQNWLKQKPTIATTIRKLNFFLFFFCCHCEWFLKFHTTFTKKMLASMVINEFYSHSIVFFIKNKLVIMIK